MESPFCPADAIKGDADFRLIETFGYVPGHQIAWLDLHIARLTASAAHFDFAFDPSEARRSIAAIAGEDPLRCRLTLAADGRVDVTTAPMPQTAKRWRFAISQTRLDAGDPFLRHKTTRRILYDQARAALPKGLDEIVFLNSRGELSEGTITNLILTTADNKQLTPPLTSGCLPGIYRQSLLDAGCVTEAVLRPEDLANARHIRLVNSLRGEMQAIWAAECEEFASFA